MEPHEIEAAKKAIAAELDHMTPQQQAAVLTRVAMESSRREISARYNSPGKLAQSIDPNVKQTPALEIIDEAFEWALHTPDARLLITCPPQEGKSSRVSIWGTLRALVDNPDRRIILASYSQSLARDHSRQARNIIREHGFGAKDPITDANLPDKLGLQLAKDDSAATSWSIRGKAGGMFAVGVGGSLTGSRADCVGQDTVLVCEHGEITASEAYRNPPKFLLGYNHETGCTQWHRLEACRRIAGRAMVTVETQEGNILTCTPDHRVYSGGRYTTAGSLRPGETLLQTSSSAGVPPVRDVIRSNGGGHTQINPAWAKLVLRRAVRKQTQGGSVSDGNVPSLRRVGSETQENHMQRQVSTDAPVATCDLPELRMVREENKGHQFAANVLRYDMCGARPFSANDREGEQPLHPVNVSEGGSTEAPAGSAAARREQVRGMRFDGEPMRPPQERGLDGQPTSEPDNGVQHLPHIAPSLENGRVHRVTAAGVGDVYDFQVDGDHNFFADGILVHNCMIIDDPMKGMAEADSILERRKVITWWESVAQTRLAPGAPVVIIMTRWHEADLAGHVLQKDKLSGTSSWRVVNIPAIAAEGVPDALGREPGEAMESARGRTLKDFQRIRNDVGERVWSALYMGQPTPAQGGLFNQEWFDRYRVSTTPPTSLTVVSVDPAETGHRDEAGIIGVSATPDGAVYVTDDRSGRMQSDEWARAAVTLALETGATTLLYEAYTTRETYERVITNAWRQIRDETRLLARHDGDLTQATLEYADQDDPPTNPYRCLKQVADLPEQTMTNPPFRIEPWTMKGNKTARAAGTRQAASTGRLRLVGTHPVLEAQAAGWQPGQNSPDRMDALVNAYEYLMKQLGRTSHIATPQETTTTATGAGFWTQTLG